MTSPGLYGMNEEQNKWKPCVCAHLIMKLLEPLLSTLTEQMHQLIAHAHPSLFCPHQLHLNESPAYI